MATKKTTTKKTPVTKKPVAAKKVARKSKASVSHTGLRKHVGLRREESAFMTFKITKQTVYWAVLGLVVIMFTVWLMRLQSDIQSLYDQIDSTNAETSLL